MIRLLVILIPLVSCTYKAETLWDDPVKREPKGKMPPSINKWHESYSNYKFGADSGGSGSGIQ